MGEKSRENFQVSVCFKDCLNRDKKCDDCIGFSELEERVETLPSASSE